MKGATRVNLEENPQKTSYGSVYRGGKRKCIASPRSFSSSPSAIPSAHYWEAGNYAAQILSRSPGGIAHASQVI